MEHPQENTKKEAANFSWKRLVNFVRTYAANCRYSFNRMLSL